MGTNSALCPAGGADGEWELCVLGTLPGGARAPARTRLAGVGRCRLLVPSTKPFVTVPRPWLRAGRALHR